MSPFALTVAPLAQQQIVRTATWWRTNRPSSPTLFEDELEAAFARITDAPATVPLYRRSPTKVFRRLLLPRSRYHVFFSLKGDPATEVVVLAVWHASRGRAPQL